MNWIRKAISMTLVILMAATMITGVGASEVHYMPDVIPTMADASYWTQSAELMLTMGTVLELARSIAPNQLVDNRAAYNNYVVWLPVRAEDGFYDKKMALISQNKSVCEGYLPFSEQNIVKVALSALGNVYGWGGSLNSEDCSSYIRNIYKCFGLELARNTTWQTAMPMAKVDLRNMCREERSSPWCCCVLCKTQKKVR